MAGAKASNAPQRVAGVLRNHHAARAHARENCAWCEQLLCCVCVCHSSGAVVCSKDMPYCLPALQPLRLAASTLGVCHMHVSVWHTWRGVNKEGFDCLVIFLRFKCEAPCCFLVCGNAIALMVHHKAT